MAYKTGARVVVVGDESQIPSIEAGKPHAQLMANNMQTATMSHLVRMRNEPLREANRLTIDKQYETALEQLTNAVHEYKNKDEMVEAKINEYLKTEDNIRRDALVISLSNAERVQLNDGIRSGLIDEGALSGARVQTQILVDRHLDQAQRGNAWYYHKDDTIKFYRENAKLGIQYGSYAKVLNVDKEFGVVTIQKDDGTTVDWQPSRVLGGTKNGVSVFRSEERDLMVGDKVRWTDNKHKEGVKRAQFASVKEIDGSNVTFELKDGSLKTFDLKETPNQHWDHGYAVTSFASQGKGAEKVIMGGDEAMQLLNEKTHYVMLSRAKEEVHVFTTDKDGYLRAIKKRTGDKTSALESIEKERRYNEMKTRQEKEASKTHKGRQKQKENTNDDLQERRRKEEERINQKHQDKEKAQAVDERGLVVDVAEKDRNQEKMLPERENVRSAELMRDSLDR